MVTLLILESDCVNVLLVFCSILSYPCMVYHSLSPKTWRHIQFWCFLHRSIALHNFRRFLLHSFWLLKFNSSIGGNIGYCVLGNGWDWLNTHLPNHIQMNSILWMCCIPLAWAYQILFFSSWSIFQFEFICLKKNLSHHLLLQGHVSHVYVDVGYISSGKSIWVDWKLKTVCLAGFCYSVQSNIPGQKCWSCTHILYSTGLHICT